jgi:hypothetical protein
LVDTGDAFGSARKLDGPPTRSAAKIKYPNAPNLKT